MTIKAKHLKSIWEKSIGVIGKKNIYPVYFTTRFGIHTFGLQKPIDILILDNQSRVVRIKENLQKNSIFFWNPMYSKVLELPHKYIPNIQESMSKKVSISERENYNDQNKNTVHS